MWKTFLLEIASLSFATLAKVLLASKSKSEQVIDPISSDKGPVSQSNSDLPQYQQTTGVK